MNWIYYEVRYPYGDLANAYRWDGAGTGEALEIKSPEISQGNLYDLGI